MFQQMLFQMKLQAKMDTYPTSKMEGLDYCNSCGICCWRRPCSFTPEDLKRVSKHMGMTESEFFKKYLAIDSPDGKKLYMIATRKDQEDLLSKYIPSDRTFDIDTPCVFLDEKENHCKIHEVKPKEGKAFECWVEQKPYDDPEKYVTEEYLKALGWDGNKYWDKE